MNRDLALMAATIRLIRDVGGGCAVLIATGSKPSQWYAGKFRLSNLAVAYLVDDGWLQVQIRDGTSRARIVTFPSFAEA